MELGESWSIESTPKDYKYDIYDMTQIGVINGEGRRYEIYKAPDGLLWYRTMIEKNGRWMTLEESIFGKKKKRPVGSRPKV